MLALFLFGEFLLHIPCWFYFSVGSFSYMSHTGFFFIIWRVSLRHPMLASLLFFLGGGGGGFSYTSCPAFIFMLGVSLTHPMLDFIFYFYFFIYLGSFSYTSRGVLIFMWGVSLTHLLLAFFFFFLNLGSFSCTSHAGFFFYLGSFSYTSRAGFILFGEFLLHIPC